MGRDFIDSRLDDIFVGKPNEWYIEDAGAVKADPLHDLNIIVEKFRFRQK